MDKVKKDNSRNRVKGLVSSGTSSSPIFIGYCADRNYPKRKQMEDSHVIKANFRGVPDQYLVCVFDGHGGARAAEWCAEHFSDCLSETLSDPNNDGLSALKKAYLIADSKLAEEKIRSGCTAVTCYINVKEGLQGHDLYTANCGDSRAVLFEENAAKRMTYDHRGSDPQEQSRVLLAGGIIYDNRVSGMLAVTRALGDPDFKDWVTPTPYVSKISIEKTTEFLVIASDGIWDVLSDKQCCEKVQECLSHGPENPEAIAEVLIEEAIKKGSCDNITVVVVIFNHDGGIGGKIMPSTNSPGKEDLVQSSSS